MAWRMILQPNGRIGRFSDIVDNFTHIDMTEKEAFDYCLNKAGMRIAKDKIKAAKEDWPPWTINQKGSGHDRWDDALNTIEIVHGLEGVEELLKEISHDL